MSRTYNMSVTITDATPDRFVEIKSAASAEWDFDDWDEYEGKLMASADGKLCAGETDEEFCERLAKAIWAANGGPCQVEVRATYLDELPYDYYSFDESDYNRLMACPAEGNQGS